MFMGEMFAEPDLDTMQLVRCAFDPDHLANPGKVFPRTPLCAERQGRMCRTPLKSRARQAFPAIAWMEAMPGSQNDPAQALEALREFVVEGTLRRGAAADAICGVLPELYAEPATEAELARVLEYANRAGNPGGARGAGRNWIGGRRRRPSI